MGMLDDLLGSGTRQQEYSDFVRRYDQGHPSEGYSDHECSRCSMERPVSRRDGAR
jgi:hypothetical protein